MKKATSLTAVVLLAIGGAFFAAKLFDRPSPRIKARETGGQNVTLGEANFNAYSDQPRSDGFCPMRLEIIQKFAGHGDYAGLNRTHKYHRGETVLGVRTITCSERGASELPGLAGLVEPTGLTTGTPEESSLAMDAQGNVRLLQKKVNGSVTFVASDEVTPPILFPAHPSVGTSWHILGQKVTVVSANASLAPFAHLLQLRFEPADDATTEAPAATTAPVEFRYYQAGIGLVAIESTQSDAPSGAGWKLQ